MDKENYSSWLAEIYNNFDSKTNQIGAQYNCSSCKQKFPTLLSAITHMKKYRTPFCYICLENFAQGHELVLHVQNVHNQSPNSLNFVEPHIGNVLIAASEQICMTKKIKQELIEDTVDSQATVEPQEQKPVVEIPVQSNDKVSRFGRRIRIKTPN